MICDDYYSPLNYLSHLHRLLINGKAATLDSEQFFAGERYDEMKTVFIALRKWRG